MSRRVRRRTPALDLIAHCSPSKPISAQKPAQRRDARQTYSLPILAIKQFLDTTLAKISARFARQAIRYTTSSLDRLDALHEDAVLK